MLDTQSGKREVEMAMFEGEPALSDVLLDPIVLAVMKSYGVDRDWFRTLLNKATQTERETASSSKSSNRVRRSPAWT